MTNLTTIDNLIIQNVAKAAGASLHNVVILVDESMQSNGTCVVLSDGSFIIKLKSDWNIRTLAHELKHVEQVQSGLFDFMAAEQELETYEKQWHELEAHEFASKY
jgi:hypothetical protein